MVTSRRNLWKGFGTSSYDTRNTPSHLSGILRYLNATNGFQSNLLSAKPQTLPDVKGRATRDGVLSSALRLTGHEICPRREFPGIFLELVKTLFNVVILGRVLTFLSRNDPQLLEGCVWIQTVSNGGMKNVLSVTDVVHRRLARQFV